MKTTILAAISIAVLASTSMASASTIDKVGSAGIVSKSYSKTVVDMTKAKLCKGEQREQAFANLRANALTTSNDLDISIGEIMVLAHKESNRVWSAALKGARLPALKESICSTEPASLIHLPDFARVRVPVDVNSRDNAKGLALEVKDKAIEAIVLRSAAQHCDFDDHEKHVAMMERVLREDEINKIAFDHDFLTSSAWTLDERKSTFRDKYGDMSECEAGSHLVAKYGDNYERDAD